MKNGKTSLISNGLIWFGAAVSIAEILTGTLLAPLGFGKGLAAIVLGHVIGCILFYFAGLIGAKTGRSAMETVKMSFGQKGALLFAVLNVLQLLGWTAVMIIGGARATGLIANPVLGTSGESLWCLIIGALIIFWVVIGLKNLGKLNVFAMGGLFILTLVLSVVVFRSGSLSFGNGVGLFEGGMSFGAAVELSVAMPLSWLPLISDYTRSAAKPKAATAVSALVYFLTSCWMYAIGLGAAIWTGQSDIATIIMQAGIGFVGVYIIIISTVSTTYLDVYSAGVSAVSIFDKLNEKWTAIIVCIVGTLFALFTPVEQYENFLYLIGSVFAPMSAILIADAFILGNDHSDKKFSPSNLGLWFVGFLLYRYFMHLDTPLGNTLPVMLIIMLLSVIVGKIRK